MRQTKRQRHRERKEVRRWWECWSHLAGKQCHLLILVETKKRCNAPKKQIKGQLLCMHLKHTYQFLHNHKRSSFIFRPLLWKQMQEKCTEITFISYNEAKEKSCIWQNENESPVNSFLIDQSLSKAKGEGERKQTLQKCWFGTDTSENRFGYLIIIFAFRWRLWCECDCRVFPFTL